MGSGVGMDSIPVSDIRHLNIRKPHKTHVSKYRLYRMQHQCRNILSINLTIGTKQNFFEENNGCLMVLYRSNYCIRKISLMLS